MIRSGASVRSRARPSDSRSPRLEVTRAWSSSSTTWRRSANSPGLSSWDSISASCSGVVSRMSGGAMRWRWRAAGRSIAGAGLDADRQPHLGDRRHQVALHVDRQRLQRRDVEGVQVGAAAGRVATPLQVDQRGQEPGQRLAGPGRRDQQGRAPLLRLFDQRQLMRPQLPAARREPARERGWERIGKFVADFRGAAHATFIAPGRPGLK